MAGGTDRAERTDRADRTDRSNANDGGTGDVVPGAPVVIRWWIAPAPRSRDPQRPYWAPFFPSITGSVRAMIRRSSAADCLWMYSRSYCSLRRASSSDWS
jgi:hypothetical protein